MTKRGTNDRKEYETLRLIKEEDLNHHGTVFATREAGLRARAMEVKGRRQVDR